jgi:large subunit ribosomal protein L2
MGIKKFRPITPTLRYKQINDNEELTQGNAPYAPLTEGIKSKAGRNNRGIITMRRRGGGHKRLYRIIDFKRNRYGINAVVETVEYDPNRTAHIALIRYIDGQRRYIIAPKGLKVGDVLQNGPEAEFKLGNTLPLHRIPVGSQIHNVELKPGKGAQIARSAGAFVELQGKDGDWFQVKLPSGEFRKIHRNCVATIGQVGNLDHEKEVSGKAGRSRWLGNRPKVRGVAMNPVDHPHGGGEGKTSSGGDPVSPWGVLAKGGKTRNNKATDKFIVRRRPSNKKKG